MAGSKDNMKQAMRELLNMVGIGPEADKDENQELVGMEAMETTAFEPEYTEVVEVQEPVFESVSVTEVQEQEVAQPVETKRFGRTNRYQQEESRLFEEELMTNTAPVASVNSDITVISAETSIFGGIQSKGVVEIHGKLKGNLEAAGNVRITGKVLGDVKGDNVVLSGCAVQGSITATSSLRIDEGTVVVGDIITADLIVDGKVKGNLLVEHSASFQKSAVLLGNVTAALVSMNEGARIQGTVCVSTTEDTSTLFGDKLDI